MAIRQHVIVADLQAPVLLLHPFFKTEMAVHDLSNLAAVEAQPATASPRLAFVMKQVDHAEGLPGVLARPEGAVGLRPGILKRLPVDVPVDDLFQAVAQLLLQLRDTSS
jgi:hypothetical protein